MSYDAIVIGARCAGAPTAMLLARAGHRVLLVDRAELPSDHALSTHLLWQAGTGRLDQWGLLDAVRTSGCPALSTIVFDTPTVTLRGRPSVPPGTPDAAWSPRRVILDQVLVEAAASAGVEVRDRTAVGELVGDGDVVAGVRLRSAAGTTYDERASIVIGADGRGSTIAHLVGATLLEERPALQGTVFSYWSDVPLEGIFVCTREGCTVYAWPTNDGLTLIGVNMPTGAYPAARRDPDAFVHAALRTHAPAFADLAASGERQSRWIGTAGISTFSRRSHGPGWALVGDAGYCIDPGTAQGLSDALRDAERLSTAVSVGLADGTMPDALAAYEAAREQSSRAMCEFTYQLSALAPNPPEIVALYEAVAQRQHHVDRFFGVLAGTQTVEAFFDPVNLAEIMADAAMATPV
jgi:2-polyprenyl-6-methoxyphenol hydroxylase-like FAD-dependent oxidoreductase